MYLAESSPWASACFIVYIQQMFHERIKLRLAREYNHEWVQSHTMLVWTVHGERISGQHHKLQKEAED